MTFYRYILLITVVGFLPAGASAHHAFVTHFDPSRTFEIEGVVTDFSIRNPHSFFTVEAIGDDGEVLNWEVELASGVMLRRMGMTSNTFEPGDKITVVAWPNRDPGKNLVYGRTYITSEGVVYGEHPDLSVNPEDEELLASVEGRWSSPLPFRNPQEPLPLNEAGMLAMEQYDPKLSPATTCEPATIPDLQLSPYLTDIRIGDDAVVFVHEAYGITRTIPLNSNASQADSTGYMGVASATFENGILAIESSDYPASRWGLSSAAQPKGPPADVPSSEQKTVTERYSVSEDGQTLTLEYRLEDPAYLTQAYTGSMTMSRASEDQVIYPFECEVDSAKRFAE